jgi:hypothetical protein
MTATPDYEYAICTYASGSAALQNLEVDVYSTVYVAPKFTYKPYSKMILLGSGSMRGAGWTVASWIWDVISSTQRDWLRTFIPGASADVWIRTRTFDSNRSYVTRRATAIWPIESEEQDTGRRLKFEIKFQNLKVS